MADAREAITADDSGQEHWNSSLSDHPHRPGINNQEEERLLSQFQNLLLTLAKGGKLDDEGEGFVPEDASRDPWDGHRDREDQVEGWGESLEILRDDLAYPLRPGIVNCGHYLRTGTCKFGASCKFNHPPNRTIPDGREKVVLDGSKEFVKKQGLVECKFYKTAGGCKHGNSCRYKHTDLEASDPSDVELNFLGLPLRPGTKECQYYMRNGTCKFAANCRFNHPDPTDVKESDISSGLCNIMSSATQSFLQQDEWEDSGPFFPAGSPPKLVPQQDGWEDSGPFFPTGSPPKLVPQQDGWEDSGPFFPTGSLTKLEVPQQDGWEDSGPFFPTGSPTKLEVPVEHSTSNSYQAPRYTSGRSIHQPLPYSTGDTLGDIGSASEYPERPGQPDCSFFLKTGNCKFKSNCRYNHPKDRLAILPQTKLNNKGLPLRPGQIPCSHYIHHGICKFGQTCKFDHPGQ